MKSWLVPTFQPTTNTDSQFFILCVVRCFYLFSNYFQFFIEIVCKIKKNVYL